MKKLIAIVLMVFLIIPNFTIGFNISEQTNFEKKVISLGDNTCENVKEIDIPTIFIPGILASWYSEEGYNEAKIKRWIPDPITHAYDPLFFTFKRAGYTIEDVFYKDEFNLYIDGNPKHSLYLFGYDWKKDNKITATLLTQLIGLILKEYEKQNGCNIGKVNIISHSMGGLVARSMLEDMCVDFKYENGLLDYSDFPTESVNGQINKFPESLCKNPFTSNTISENIKVNKFVTISTPHRGSPKSIVVWEHGDIELTDGFGFGTALKWQTNGLTDLTDEGFYDIVHGYDARYPNGVVSLGQLLPDIKNQNSYNDKMKYLYKYYPKETSFIDSSSVNKKWYLDNSYYPTNSFLEELNKKENIEKIFDKVTGKYISYFSRTTQTSGNNNITELGLDNTKEDISVISYGSYLTDKYINNNELSGYKIDNTYNIGDDVKDIYDKYGNYQDRDYKGYYNISKVGQDENGFGGDGTVPTYNLLLVPNDSDEGKEIKNDKFQSIEISCNGKDKDLYDVFRTKGDDLDNEICSHTTMPVAVSQKVKNFITDGVDYPVNYEQSEIIRNLGYTYYNYIGKKTIKTINTYGAFGYTSYNGVYYESDTEDYGIKNNSKLDDYFENDRFIATQSWNNSGEENYSLKLGSNLGNLDRLLKYDVLSPINLLITDSQGRRIGIDPETGLIINEIPGAWTSGDTEGSNEPEFFLIPVEGTGAFNHEIKTYGTGNGEYHIVVEEVILDENTSSGTTEKLVIAGNAKQAFGEDYQVAISKSGEKTFENLTENIDPSIDLEISSIKTDKANYLLSYFVRGNSEKVDKIKYSLERDSESSSEGQKLVEKTLDIDGKINLELKEFGKYKLTLELVDKNKNILDTKVVEIEKLEKKETIGDKIVKSTENIFPTQDLSFNKILGEDLLGILNLYNNKDNYFDLNNGFGINSSFDGKINDDGNGNIQVLISDGKTNTFKLNSDFSYTKTLDNNLEIETDFDYIKITDSDKTYFFSKKNYLLEKIIINDKEYNLFYNNKNKLTYINLLDKLEFEFIYDINNGNLLEIKNKYGDILTFDYENINGVYLLSKINSESLLYDKNGEIKNIEDISRKVFKNNEIYNKKLENIFYKIEQLKLTNSKKEKLSKNIKLKKEIFLSKIQYFYNKKLISYYIDQIIGYLDN